MNENPWIQHPDEPILWFSRFERYRLKGPKRTMLSLFNEFRREQEKEPLKSVPTAWRDMAARWNWDERAEAWDKVNLAADAQSDEEARIEARKKRREVYYALADRLLEAIDSLDTSSPRLGEIASAVKVLNDGLRTEFNDNPANKTEISGDGSLTIRVKYGSDDDSPEE